MPPLERDALFAALTRPQTLGGVAYGLVVLNLVLCAELFIVFKTVWVLGLAVLVHAAAWAACQREPFIFDIWRVRATLCPRSATRSVWGCNAYRP